MDNEVSHSIHIAVQLVVVAFIAGALVFFTAMSVNFGRHSVTEITDIHARTYAAELRQTADYGAVPVASVIAMLQKNVNAIRSISGTVYGVSVTEPEHLGHPALLAKKIRLSVTSEYDFYDVVVLEE